jgi:hypothetical protein
MTTWNGLFVHRDTPAEVRERIAVVAERVVLGEHRAAHRRRYRRRGVLAGCRGLGGAHRA